MYVTLRTHSLNRLGPHPKLGKFFIPKSHYPHQPNYRIKHNGVSNVNNELNWGGVDAFFDKNDLHLF